VRHVGIQVELGEWRASRWFMCGEGISLLSQLISEFQSC